MVRILFIFMLFIAAFSPSQANATTLVSGTTVTGSLVANGTNIYTFEGTAGSVMELHGHASYSVSIKLYRPSGPAMNKFGGRYNATALPETGTYTVEINTNGGQSGPYTLYYYHGAEAVSHGTLSSGTTVSDELGLFELHSYTFNASASQQVSLTATGEDGAIAITLVNPDGSREARFSNSLSKTLATTGAYGVIVEYSATSGSGDYTLSMTLSP